MVPDAVGAAGTHEALWGCCRAGAPGCTSPRVYLSGEPGPGVPHVDSVGRVLPPVLAVELRQPPLAKRPPRSPGCRTYPSSPQPPLGAACLHL